MKKIFKRVYFEEIINNWLNNVKNNIKISTYSYYSTVVQKHILPTMGKIDTRLINQSVVQKFVEELSNTNIKESTLRQVIIILKQILKFADISVNIKLPKVTKSRITIYNEHDKKKLEKYLCDNLTEISFGILLSIHLGLRIGEVCGIQWKDIDIQEGLLTVEKTVERIKNFDSSNNKTKLMILPAKTSSSNRILPLDKKLLSLLKKLKQNNKEDNFLLTSSGKCMDPRTYYNKYLKILKEIDLNKNYHCLRHTFATECIDLGLNPKSLSEILGHSDIKTTLSLYVHPDIKKTRDFLNANFY